MKQNRILMGVAALSAILLTAGCMKEKDFHEEGTQVTFTAAASSWDVGLRTRTEYSGKDERGASIGKSSDYERVDWVQGYDRIRVLCAACPDGPLGDYIVSGSPTSDGEKSIVSTITPLEGYGLHWGTSDHYFYALYPAPGMQSNYDFGTERTVSASNAKIETNGTNGAKITGVVPASQKAVKVGNEYKANMNYAYMYAETKIGAGTTGSVKLTFSPLVTAFEVSLKAVVGDEVNSNLTSVELSSTSTDLTGTFQAVLSHGSNPVITAVEGTTGKKITVTVPGEGVRLSTSEAVKFTMLALPVKQTDLTLTLYFANGSKRSLALKSDGTPLSVDACKKMYISNVGVPGSIYTLEVVGPYASFPAESSSQTYTVKSCVDQSGTDSGVAWTAQFMAEGSTTWSNTAPSWLTAFTASDANGSTTDKAYTATVAKNDVTYPKTWTGPTTVGSNNSKANAKDLSLQDIYGTTISQTTANCYVVSAPGWYKIPCVYGNAIKNGSVNEIAYKNNNSDKYALKAFLRHDDQPITAPWITKATSGTGVDKGNGIAVTKAALIWQDWENLVSQVSYENNYLYFYVAPASIWQGNAIVAAELADDTIAWSWHIWVMDKVDNLRTVRVSNPESAQKTLDFMKLNLGWYDAENLTYPRSVKVKITQAESGKTAEFLIYQQQSLAAGGNVYYQWGRKDPMLGFDENFVEKTQYYPSESRKFQLHEGEQVSLGTGIKTPYVFYGCSGVTFITGDEGYKHTGWFTPRHDNLWNVNGVFENDVAVVKTVYDPCPVGFKMPNRNAFTAFKGETPFTEGREPWNSLSDPVNWNFGLTFDVSSTEKLYFPSTSLREHTTGELRTFLISAFIHMAAVAEHRVPSGEPYDPLQISGVYLQIDEPHFVTENSGNPEGPILIQSMHRNGVPSYGFSVRPIAE